ncbi:MAG: hypothetical protein ACYC4S_09655 [Rhodoferax sp.]
MTNKPDAHPSNAQRPHLRNIHRTPAGYVDYGRQLITLKGNAKPGGFAGVLRDLGIDHSSALQAMRAARSYEFHMMRLIESVTRMSELLAVDELELSQMPQRIGSPYQAMERNEFRELMRQRSGMDKAVHDDRTRLADDEEHLVDVYRRCEYEAKTVILQAVKLLDVDGGKDRGIGH